MRKIFIFILFYFYFTFLVNETYPPSLTSTVTFIVANILNFSHNYPPGVVVLFGIFVTSQT